MSPSEETSRRMSEARVPDDEVLRVVKALHKIVTEADGSPISLADTLADSLYMPQNKARVRLRRAIDAGLIEPIGYGPIKKGRKYASKVGGRTDEEILSSWRSVAGRVVPGTSRIYWGSLTEARVLRLARAVDEAITRARYKPVSLAPVASEALDYISSAPRVLTELARIGLTTEIDNQGKKGRVHASIVGYLTDAEIVQVHRDYVENGRPYLSRPGRTPSNAPIKVEVSVQALDALMERWGNAVSGFASARAENLELRYRIGEEELEGRVLRDALAEAEADVKRLRVERDTISNLEKLLRQAIARRDALSEELHAVKPKIDRLEKANTRLHEALESAKKVVAQAIADVKKDRREAQANHKKLERELAKANRTLERAQTRNKELSTKARRAKRLEAARDRAESIVSALNIEVKALRRQVGEEGRTIASLEVELVKAISENRALRERNADLESSEARLSEEVKTLRSRVSEEGRTTKSLEVRLEEIFSENEALKESSEADPLNSDKVTDLTSRSVGEVLRWAGFSE